MAVLRILVVEDDPNDVLLVERALKQGLGEIAIYSVQNGVDAALYLKGEAKFADRRRFPLPQAILLDIQMPLFNGFEFLEWLRNEAEAAQRKIPVAVMSSSDDPGDISRAYRSGADAYVIKSTRWQEFRQRLREMAAEWIRRTESPAPMAKKRRRKI